MYKNRFKQWKLTKYLKGSGAAQVAHNAVQGDNGNLPVIRGRQTGAKRLKDHLGRVVPISNPTLVDRQLASPDELRSSEGSLHIVIHLTNARMQLDRFGFTDTGRYGWNEDYAMTFWQDIRTGVQRIYQDKNDRAAFRLLNKAFTWYSMALDAVEPTLIWTTMITVLQLAQATEELANTFVRYASALCLIKLGSSHPFSRLWARIKSMSIAQFRQSAAAILEAYFDASNCDSRTARDFRASSLLQSARWLFLTGASSFESTQATFQVGLEELRTTKDNVVREDWYWWARSVYCEFLSDSGRHEEANGAMEAIGLHWHGGHPDLTYENLWDLHLGMVYYLQRAKILQRLGRGDEATLYLIGAYEVSKLHESANSKSNRARCAAELEAHYRRQGDTESAEKIHDEAEAFWTALVEEKSLDTK